MWRRERVEHDGRYYQLPLPADKGTGLGKPLKIITHPVRPQIPIWLAALGPKNVRAGGRDRRRLAADPVHARPGP